MTVLDTNFLIDLLDDDPEALRIADSFDNPKTTIINVFELYHGASNSLSPEENFSKINILLKSLDILEFDRVSALKAGSIKTKLVDSGKSIDAYDFLIAGIVIANREELITRDHHFKLIKGLRCRTW